MPSDNGVAGAPAGYQLEAGEDDQPVVVPLSRREIILSAVTRAAEQFLGGSSATWRESVNQIIAELGQRLNVKRIFLLKNQKVTADMVITGLQYEWVNRGAQPLIHSDGLNSFSLHEKGFGRWAGILYHDGLINDDIANLPENERGIFLSPGVKSIICVPVFVGDQWWGFIGFEDYPFAGSCSQAELDAFRTIAVTFGAAIRRKRAEEMLQKFQLGIERSNDVIFMTDPKGDIIYTNPAFTSVYGFTPLEATGQNPRILNSNKHDKAFFAQFWSSLVQKSAFAAEIINKTKSGDLLTVETTVTPVLSEQNEILAYLTIQRDITQRIKMEEALRHEKSQVEQKAKEIEDIAKFPAEDPSPIMRVSKEGTILYANRAAEPVLTLWQTGVDGTVPSEWQEILTEAFSHNQSRSKDIAIDSRIFSFHLVPVTQSGYVNVYGHDVTSEREIDRLKSEFIALASHQLRTPLTSLRWYSERLLKDNNQLSEKQIESGQVIRDTTINMAKLVDDLLNISRIERGKIEIKPETADLAQTIEKVIKEMAGQAHEKDIKVGFNNQSQLKPFNFDPRLIEQVVLNLLSNAIKYTPNNGQINIFLSEDQNLAIVEVKDTGIGIPKDFEAKMFQRFSRAHNALDAGIEGTGLGLSFVKMILDKSGGKIWHQSVEAEGTSMYFSLPVR